MMSFLFEQKQIRGETPCIGTYIRKLSIICWITSAPLICLDLRFTCKKTRVENMKKNAFIISNIKKILEARNSKGRIRHKPE
jgi:hypothetical protein